jgi:hypothetical protein
MAGLPLGLYALRTIIIGASAHSTFLIHRNHLTGWCFSVEQRHISGVRNDVDPLE